MSKINNYVLYKTNWIDSLASYFLNIKITNDRIENLRTTLCSQNNFSPETLFQILDYGNKNFLGLNDFKRYLNEFSFNFNEQHLRKFIHNYDKDSDFSLNFTEFLSIILPVKNLDLKKNILSKINQTFCKPNITNEINNIFIELICEELKLISSSINTAKICRESKGFTSYESFIEIAGNEKYITIKNLYNFLIRNGVTISECDVQQLMFRIDSDNDGSISFREFEEIFAPVYDNINNKNNLNLQCNENNYYINNYKQKINDNIPNTVKEETFTFGKNPLKNNITRNYSNKIVYNKTQETIKEIKNENKDYYSLPYKSNSQKKTNNVSKNNYLFEQYNNMNYKTNKADKEKKNIYNKYNNSIFSFERNNHSVSLPTNYNENNNNNYNNNNYNTYNYNNYINNRGYNKNNYNYNNTDRYNNNYYNKNNNSYIFNRTEKTARTSRNNYPIVSNIKKEYNTNNINHNSIMNSKTIDVNKNFVRNKNNPLNKNNKMSLINRTERANYENIDIFQSPENSKQSPIYNTLFKSPKNKNTKTPLNYDYSTNYDEGRMEHNKKNKNRNYSMTDINRDFRNNNINNLTIPKNEKNENNEFLIRSNISNLFNRQRNQNNKNISKEVKVNDIGFYNYDKVANDDVKINNDNNDYFSKFSNYEEGKFNEERNLIEDSLFNRRLNKYY